MFIKYSNEKAFEVSKDEELDTKIEFFRQRTFLEQSIVGLKKRVNVCVRKNDSYYKVMEDNMVLIKEINKLRLELKTNHKKYDNLASAFKAKGSKNNTAVKRVKSNNLKKSGATSNAVEKQCKEQINVSVRT